MTPATQPPWKSASGINEADPAYAMTRVGVVGAGLMGRQIAAHSLAAGHEIVLMDSNAETLQSSLSWIADFLEAQQKSPECLPRLSVATSYADFERAGLIIEAVTEQPAVKGDVLRNLESAVLPATLIGTNTSSIAVSRLAETMRHPERLCGVHFCHPLDHRLLVEIVPFDRTQERVTSLALQFARSIGRVPLVVKDQPGFLVNRLLFPYLGAALGLAERGHPLQAIERAAQSGGLPIGPFSFLDDIGIDVAVRVGMVLDGAYPGRLRPSQLLVALYKHQYWGRKSGAGFFRYDQSRVLGLNPALCDLAVNSSGASSLLSKPPGCLVQALLNPLILESTVCLEEQIVPSMGEIDVALRHGLGFPRLAVLRECLSGTSDSEDVILLN